MKKTYEMVLSYPKIFDLPEDKRGLPGDLDRGDATSTKKFLRELAKNPVATTDAYFTSEADMNDLLECEDFDNKVVNPQTGEESTRIKDGSDEFGIGKYIRLKRKLNDLIEYVDKKSGELKTIDKGGAPSVKILNAEGDTFEDYDYDKLGAPSNGTTSKIRFEVYKGNLRLEAFGITDLVEFVPNEENEDGF